MPVGAVGNGARGERCRVTVIAIVRAWEVLLECVEQNQACLLGSPVGLVLQKVEKDRLGLPKADPVARRTERCQAARRVQLSVKQPVERSAKISEAQQRRILARLKAGLLDEPTQGRRVDRVIGGSRRRTHKGSAQSRQTKREDSLPLHHTFPKWHAV